jgi:uncharacterized protein (DUF2249 family)
MTDFVDLDVRPILRAGGEPFATILAVLGQLAPGQGLRLYTPFKPVPLFQVMANRGFMHEATEIEDGDWEVRFRPGAAVAEAIALMPADDWPEPSVHLDNRELLPPEPMVRILAAAEELEPGQTLSALLRREPVFLFPELTKRGHQWRGGFTPDGKAYELTVRVAA